MHISEEVGVPNVTCVVTCLVENQQWVCSVSPGETVYGATIACWKPLSQ